MTGSLVADGVLFSDTSWHYLVGPLLAVVAIGVLALVLKWSSFKSPAPATTRVPSGTGFGLLVPVATSPDRVDLDRLREAMVLRGLRSTVGVDEAGVPALLVFPADYPAARRILEQTG